MTIYLLASLKYLQFKFQIPAYTYICICLYFCKKYCHIHSDPAGRVDRDFIPNQRGPQAPPPSSEALPPSADAAAAGAAAAASSSLSSPSFDALAEPSADAPADPRLH
jgi:hypothetical protein